MDRFFGLDNTSAPDKDAALLTTVHDDVEKNLICGILEEEKIPYLVKDRGTGEVARIVFGFSVFGCDIYVPQALQEKATELLDAYRNGEAYDDDEIVVDPDAETDD